MLKLGHIARASILLGALTGGLLINPLPVHADTPGCVTQSEFRRVHTDMSKKQVRRLFDVHGEPAGGGAGGYTLWYPSCISVNAGGGDIGAYITYNGDTNRVLEKRFL